MIRILLLFCFCVASFQVAASDFITVKGSQLWRNDKPYYFIGTNFWYGPILASEGEGGNRERLCEELDSMKSLGLNNLRILVGADAGSVNANTVKPYLQLKPGVLNDTLLNGFDYLIMEMEKRAMVGVFYLTNSWDWSGGFGFYLKQTKGYDDSPKSTGEGYDAYVKYAAAFSRDQQAQNIYYDFVRHIVMRVNHYTGIAYKNSPAIMAWQICNEPRPFSKENKEGFSAWITKAAQLIKQLDPNHLVSTGSEGIYGCENDELLYEQIHNNPNIDYLTIHVWPINWRWASRDNLYKSLPNVYVKSQEYISLHERLAQKVGKPLVIEEFGYARDNNFYLPGSRTQCRDAFYNFIFSKILQNKSSDGVIAGCNFWGWGGSGRPTGDAWALGHDYLCDPPHEPQGWYSVYDCDSTTLTLIRNNTAKISPVQ